MGQTLWVAALEDFIEMVARPKEGEYDSYGEGVAEDVFMVVKLGDKHFRKNGWRSSYGGTDWDGECREVKPQPRTITVYDYA
ncbi:hypothetical protein A6A27_32020 [Micromonospora sp. CB01531]|nr:hypothetical protein A6A27_32020 [Micromonospora sp. CB01531]